MPKYELNIRDYWRIILRREAVIVTSTVFIIFISLVYAFSQPKIYQARATVKVERVKTAASLLLDTIMSWSPGDILATESKVIESWPVSERAAKDLGWISDDTPKAKAREIIAQIHDNIHTRTISDTNLIDIIAQSNSAKGAAIVANAVSRAYVEENKLMRRRSSREVREFIEQSLEIADKKLRASEDALKEFKGKEKSTGIALQLEDKIIDLRAVQAQYLNQYTEKHPKVVEINGQIAQLEKEYEMLPVKEIEFARLRREVLINEKSYENLKEKLEEAKIAEAGHVGEAVLVNPAVMPLRPIGPGILTNVLLGVVLGVVVGVMMGFVVEALDTSVGAIEDVEESSKLPVLAVISHIRGDDKKLTLKERFLQNIPYYQIRKEDSMHKRLIAHFDPGSMAAEAFRTLRTNLKIGPDNKTVLFTSTVHEEGKTSVAVNTAITLAQSGVKTLLLCCDLRRPAISRTFGLGRKAGLSEILTGAISLEEGINSITHLMMGDLGWENVMKTPGLDNLSIIAGGKAFPQPAELIGSAKMKDLLDTLKVRFQAIMIDSPPVLPVTDALLLSPYADSVVIVYQAGRAARASLIRAKNLLISSGAHLKGVVLNHVRPATEQMERSYPYYKYKYKREGA